MQFYKIVFISYNHLGLKILQGGYKKKVPFCPFKKRKSIFRLETQNSMFYIGSNLYFGYNTKLQPFTV